MEGMSIQIILEAEPHQQTNLQTKGQGCCLGGESHTRQGCLASWLCYFENLGASASLKREECAMGWCWGRLEGFCYEWVS